MVRLGCIAGIYGVAAGICRVRTHKFAFIKGVQNVVICVVDVVALMVKNSVAETS